MIIFEILIVLMTIEDISRANLTAVCCGVLKNALGGPLGAV